MSKAREQFDSWLFWLEARAWARDAHPSWLYMADQKNNPELRKEYREKILTTYIELQEAFSEV